MEGAPMAIVGAMKSTEKVALAAEAGARLPARSLAVPAATVMPTVPAPVNPESVTVRVFPIPETTTLVTTAVPVLFNVIFADVRVEALKLTSA